MEIAKEDTPLLSIACTTYNQESYITMAIEGFLSQKTNFTIEIIIHDDASTDKTAEIVKEYAARYPHLIIPILQVENQYSRGIKPWTSYIFPRAKGKYIAICEGDDYWTDPLKLQKQVDVLENNDDFNISLGKYMILIDRENRLVAPKESSVLEKKKDLYLKDYLKHKFSHTSTFVIRKESIKYPGWLNNVYAGDQALIALSAQDKQIKYHDDYFSVYRIHNSSITNSYGTKEAIDKFIYLLERINEHYNYKYANIIRIRKIKFSVYKLVLATKSNNIERIFRRILHTVNIKIW
jgi:glycosyltransferase involved in cell wall biosynthesis